MSASLPNVETAAAWKQEVNDRLAAHRTRRTRRGEGHPTLPGLDNLSAGDDAPLKSSIAAKVAARYAKAPTYSEMLAAEAQNAVNAAAVAANAANQAQAAAQAILTGLDIREPSHARLDQPVAQAARHTEAAAPVVSRRAQEDRGETRREAWPDTVVNAAAYPLSRNEEFSRNELRGNEPRGDKNRVSAAAGSVATQASGELRITLAAEAEFEYEAPQPLPANLIEFPRELIATRRARPRLAEGPLRDEMGVDSDLSQLRIFEVEADSISTIPLLEQSQTEWSSIRLEAYPEPEVSRQDERREQHAARQDAPAEQASSMELPLQTACLEDRAMAAVVDLALVSAAFLIYVLVFVACTSYPPTGKPALIGAAVSFFAIAMAYQLLFFAYAESTPGMRYAKIALCTFDDENPTRKGMRVRIAAMLLSLCPLGLGCAWVFFDEDHLSWHDRITRTYQRSYR